MAAIRPHAYFGIKIDAIKVQHANLFMKRKKNLMLYHVNSKINAIDLIVSSVIKLNIKNNLFFLTIKLPLVYIRLSKCYKMGVSIESSSL